MTHADFDSKTRTACADRELGRKLRASSERQKEARAAACAELGDVERFRNLAAAIRDDVLANLDECLERFTDTAGRAGVQVHWACDALEARTVIRHIARDYGVTEIVKSKSMITEEIELNDHLQREGLTVTETDLGEFIIQLLDQAPAHIIFPALHLDAEEVAAIFRSRIGYDGPSEPEALTRAARRHLRDRFRIARMGVSGVNFALANEGMWAVCTNEGNGRYVTGMPGVYVAVMGIERIVRDAASAAVILKLLGRFATGQRITQYVNFTCAPANREGPEHVHLVLLDNGRSHILGTPYRQMLRCIRCGACLNVCPVFQYIGGQSFPGCYSGPMGSVLLPLQKGLGTAGDAAKACSLCGLCAEVCPVKIPLPDLLLDLRRDLTAAGIGSFAERVAMSTGAWILSRPMMYRAAQKAARFSLNALGKRGWVESLPWMPGRWTDVRDFPVPARRSFLSEFARERYMNMQNEIRHEE